MNNDGRWKSRILYGNEAWNCRFPRPAYWSPLLFSVLQNIKFLCFAGLFGLSIRIRRIRRKIEILVWIRVSKRSDLSLPMPEALQWTCFPFTSSPTRLRSEHKFKRRLSAELIDFQVRDISVLNFVLNKFFDSVAMMFNFDVNRNHWNITNFSSIDLDILILLFIYQHYSFISFIVLS